MYMYMYIHILTWTIELAGLGSNGEPREKRCKV